MNNLNVEDLRQKVIGRVLTAENEEFNLARTPWDLSVIFEPAVVLMAANSDDIITAVQFAKDNHMKIAVTNSGHGVALPAIGSLLINVSEMTNVRVDPDKQTAWMEGGAKWAHVLEKAQEVGLAPLMGSSSDIGAAGFTSGGGIGWLSRKYGLSVDHVLAMDVVTADGQLIHADKDENPDLFWAMRGAGAAFGVITAMEVELFPIRNAFAGSLMYPSELAHDVFTRYRDWATGLDEEWTTSISILNLPPLPFLPEFLRGKSVVVIRGCYLGGMEAGKADITHFLNWQEPMMNLFRPIEYSEADIISDDPKDPTAALATNVILNGITDNVIQTLIKYAVPTDGPSPLMMAEILHAGGQIAKADPSTTAFSQHDAPFILKIIGINPEPAVGRAFLALADKLKNELKADAQDGVFLNFLTGDEKWQHSKAAFSPEAYQKLTALKKQYDPDNTFCFSLNIAPE